MVRYPNTQSLHRPKDVEITNTKVFVASQIKQIEIQMGDDEAPQQVYEYILDEYTKNEYIEKQGADINYLATKLGIDLNNKT